MPPKSSDFTVGQRVVCLRPGDYVSPLDKYLTARVGVVERVYPPERPDRQYCGQINKVSVRWLKRGGRGKEKIMAMSPADIGPEYG